MTAPAPVAPRPRRAADAAARRVVAVMDTVQVSGPGKQLAALALELRSRGVSLEVLGFQRVGRPRYAYFDYLDQRGVPVHVIEERGRFDRGLPARFAARVAALGASVVQTHGYKATVTQLLARRAGAPWPWLGVFHGDTTENLATRLYHAVDKVALRAADAVICMSPGQRDALVRRGVPARVVFNAVLPDASNPPAAEQARIAALAATLPRPLLGVVGRLSPEKGVDLFLDAVARLRADGFAGGALIVGDGPERAALEATARARGLGPDVVAFAGATPAVAVVYAAIDLLVIPSRSEGLPNVLLEALAADRPAVSTRVGAVPDVLTDADAGIIVPAGAPAAIADGIRRALPLATSDAARAARQATVRRFSLAHRADAHVALYDELAGVAGGRHS